MMKKYFFFAFLLLILINFSYIYADDEDYSGPNQRPSANITSVSEIYVNKDLINLKCFDPDIFIEDISESYLCNKTLWYYLSSGSCSNQKSDYIFSVVSGHKNTASVLVECSNFNDANYLCLWVEDNFGLSDYSQSSRLLIDCTKPLVLINSPTTLNPVVKQNTDFVDVNFSITENLPSSYNLTISNLEGDVICSISEPISSSGDFTQRCSWENADSGNYNVKVTSVDKALNVSTAQEFGAIIIGTPVEEEIQCSDWIELYLVENSSFPLENAFNLSDVCYKRWSDVNYIVDVSDCNGVVSSISVDELNYVDIGVSNQVLGEDYFVTCQVKVNAVSEEQEENGSFKITVYKLGEIDLLVKYNNIIYGADHEGELQLPAVPGEQVCFDLVIKNSLIAETNMKPIDLVFVLDASGSMQNEINSVKTALNSIATNIRNLCSSVPDPPQDCIRIGASIIEGSGSKLTGFPWVDLSVNENNVTNMLNDITAAGAYEPWADFIINIIDSTALDPKSEVVNKMSWRTSDAAKKLIIVTSDAKSDTQLYNKYLVSQVKDYAVPNGVVVSALGKTSSCDSGCPLTLVDGVLGGEMVTVANDTGGTALVYTSYAELGPKIQDLIFEQISSDDLYLTQVEGPEIIGYTNPIRVDRLSTKEVNVCFTPTTQNEKIILLLNAASSDNIAIIQTTDSNAIDSNIHAIAGPFVGKEGEPIVIYGGNSFDNDGNPLDYNWIDLSTNQVLSNVEIFDYLPEDNEFKEIKLIVTSLGGLRSDEVTTSITIENLPPEVLIDSLDTIQINEELLLFAVAKDPSSIDEAAFNESSYSWDLDNDGVFGDVISAFATKNWSAFGDYNVHVKVTDKDGDFAYASKTIKVVPVQEYFGDVFDVKVINTIKNGSISEIVDEENPFIIDALVLNKNEDILITDINLFIFSATNGKVLYEGYLQDYHLKGGNNNVQFQINSPMDKNLIATNNYLVKVYVRPILSEQYVLNNRKEKIITVSIAEKQMIPDNGLISVILVLIGLMIVSVKKNNKK